MMEKAALKRIITKIGKGFLIFVLLLLTYSLFWAEKSYGNIGFAEIVFHLNMPKKGLSHDVLDSYLRNAVFPAGISLIVIVFLQKVCKRKMNDIVFHGILATWAMLLVFKADRGFGFLDWVQDMITRSQFIEDEYISANDVELVFPEQKRNLIYIFLESGETSAQDVANGGLFENNYIPELTKLADDNISFSQSEKLEGACVAPLCGWTMAGLLAETSGLPLKMYDIGKTVDNSMGKYEYFLPGAITLGDILEDAGYKNYFMAGSEFSYGGRESYFTSHGNYEIFDYHTAIERNKIPEDYYVWWGFEDAKLYSYAKEVLLDLASEDQPFNFSMLTVDTHHEDGYVCELCPDIWDEQYANVWSCASRQLNEFVEWIQQQEFYENTTIVIVGDHCSMDTDFYAEVVADKHAGSVERKIYNAFINSATEPMNEKNRLFTTLDFFPTTLASLGVSIEGNRLGLGVNLFSNERTLSEKYGYEYLFEELGKKSRYYDYELLYR